MDLARWLVGPDNPLTARVTVNRMWAAHFGTGMVDTVEDFGTKGDRPTHPELLDWLATEFIRRGWDMKAMHRLIVTSATYRQIVARLAGAVRTRSAQPAVGPRAAVSRSRRKWCAIRRWRCRGLLSPKIGGPSVLPPMPDGIWNALQRRPMGDQQRPRTAIAADLYTFWRRTSRLSVVHVRFDAPSREICVVRRPRTNTPLQALTVLNDPVYVEAAQALGPADASKSADRSAGQRVDLWLPARAGPAADASRSSSGCRAVSPRDRAVRERRRDGRAQWPAPAAAAGRRIGGRLAELAAWTVVANVLLNLDETSQMGKRMNSWIRTSNNLQRHHAPHFFQRSGAGIGTLALAAMANERLFAERRPHGRIAAGPRQSAGAEAAAFSGRRPST